MFGGFVACARWVFRQEVSLVDHITAMLGLGKHCLGDIYGQFGVKTTIWCWMNMFMKSTMFPLRNCINHVERVWLVWKLLNRPRSCKHRQSAHVRVEAGRGILATVGIQLGRLLYLDGFTCVKVAYSTGDRGYKVEMWTRFLAQNEPCILPRH